MYIRFLIILNSLLLIAACKQREKPETVIEPKEDPVITMQESIEMSQNWTKDESILIDKYVARRNWPAITSPTGVRYFIYEKGDGAKAEEGMVAYVNYEIRLLDAENTLAYTNEGSKPVDFLISMDDVESGLHEAITYMHEGDKAYVILPHYLAHGVGGDLDKIPPLSPVLYHLELVSVKEYE